MSALDRQAQAYEERIKRLDRAHTHSANKCEQLADQNTELREALRAMLAWFGPLCQECENQGSGSHLAGCGSCGRILPEEPWVTAARATLNKGVPDGT